MEWYIIGALVLLVVILLFVKMPNKAIKLLTGQIMTFLKINEGFLVQGVYSTLPKEIKSVVKSEHIAQVISYAIFYIGVLLKEDKSI
jgi:hypothetical protein